MDDRDIATRFDSTRQTAQVHSKGLLTEFEIDFDCLGEVLVDHSLGRWNDQEMKETWGISYVQRISDS